MAELVYLLCALTSAFVAVLLMRSYRRQRTRLLLWSMLCFTMFAINNVLLVVDLMLVPDIDFGLARTLTALAGVVLLVVGLTWEES